MSVNFKFVISNLVRQNLMLKIVQEIAALTVTLVACLFLQGIMQSSDFSHYLSYLSSYLGTYQVTQLIFFFYALIASFRWLPKSAMRPVGADASHTDCILVVGVSRPKLAVVFLTVMLISLFLTFHVLYDSAVYNIQAAQAVHERHRLSLVASASASASAAAAAAPPYASANGNHLPVFVKPVASSNQLSHPMVFPSSRVHFPKTSRRLPQVSNGMRSLERGKFRGVNCQLIVAGADYRCTQVRHAGAARDALSASAHTEGRRRGALLRP